jgi:hypothetical protein
VSIEVLVIGVSTVIARSKSDEATQLAEQILDCFVELVIGRRFRADPLAHNDVFILPAQYHGCAGKIQ